MAGEVHLIVVAREGVGGATSPRLVSRKAAITLEARLNNGEPVSARLKSHCDTRIRDKGDHPLVAAWELQVDADTAVLAAVCRARIRPYGDDVLVEGDIKDGARLIDRDDGGAAGAAGADGGDAVCYCQPVVECFPQRALRTPE